MDEGAFEEEKIQFDQNRNKMDYYGRDTQKSIMDSERRQKIV